MPGWLVTPWRLPYAALRPGASKKASQTAIDQSEPENDAQTPEERVATASRQRRPALTEVLRAPEHETTHKSLRHMPALPHRASIRSRSIVAEAGARSGTTKSAGSLPISIPQKHSSKNMALATRTRHEDSPCAVEPPTWATTPLGSSCNVATEQLASRNQSGALSTTSPATKLCFARTGSRERANVSAIATEMSSAPPSPQVNVRSPVKTTTREAISQAQSFGTFEDAFDISMYEIKARRRSLIARGLGNFWLALPDIDRNLRDPSGHKHFKKQRADPLQPPSLGYFDVMLIDENQRASGYRVDYQIPVSYLIDQFCLEMKLCRAAHKFYHEVHPSRIHPSPNHAEGRYLRSKNKQRIFVDLSMKELEIWQGSVIWIVQQQTRFRLDVILEKEVQDKVFTGGNEGTGPFPQTPVEWKPRYIPLEIV